MGIKEPVTIQLTCCVCGRVDNVNTNRLELYTDEVRKSHRCFRHKGAKIVKKEEVMAEKNVPVLDVSEEQLVEICNLLWVPAGWKKEIKKRWGAGAKTLSALLVELDSITDTKTRVRGDELKLQKMKEKIKAAVRRTLADVLKVEIA